MYGELKAAMRENSVVMVAYGNERVIFCTIDLKVLFVLKFLIFHVSLVNFFHIKVINLLMAGGIHL